MLTYKYPEVGEPCRQIVIPTPIEGSGLLYTPGTPDFTVAKFAVKPESTLTLPVRDGPSILLVVAGKGGKFSARRQTGEVYNEKELHRGMTLFMDANDLLDVSANQDQLQIFQAFC